MVNALSICLHTDKPTQPKNKLNEPNKKTAPSYTRKLHTSKIENIDECGKYAHQARKLEVRQTTVFFFSFWLLLIGSGCCLWAMNKVFQINIFHVRRLNMYMYLLNEKSTRQHARWRNEKRRRQSREERDHDETENDNNVSGNSSGWR